jgi:hypothetical protein
MNSKRLLELMQQDIKYRLYRYYSDAIEDFEKELTKNLTTLYEKELAAFKDKIAAQLSEQQEEIIAEYLITLEMNEDPQSLGTNFIIKVRE